MNDEDSGEVQIGTVGWVNEDEVVDLGADDDKHALVRVTLFDGRDRSAALADPGVAEGRRVLAQISAPGFNVPKKGTVVWVLRAAGMNAWLIAGNPVPTPTDQFKGTERTLVDYGDETDVVIRARSVTLQSAAGHFIGLGPKTGIQFGDADGNGGELKAGRWLFFVAEDGDAKSFLRLTSAAVDVTNKATLGTATLKVGDGKVKVGGNSFSAVVGNVALGALATPVSAAQYGPGIGVPSTTVFIQP